MSRTKLQIWGMVAICASCAWGTPSITQVNVRQQWPWSTDINVDFHIVNDEGTPVDVSIALTNGTKGVAVPFHAVSGPGQILGVGNGNAHAFEAFTKTDSHPLFYGKAVAVIRRDAPGELKLEVSAPGLAPATAELP